MINLSNWLDSRGTFKDVSFGEVELQIVSLSADLIEQLKTLPRWRDMYDFVAEHGLAHNRTRISDDENMVDDLPVIWAIKEFVEAKKEIVEAICELSDIADVLAVKIEAEEKDDKEMAELEAAENTNVINGDATIPDINLGQLHEDAALNP